MGSLKLYAGLAGFLAVATSSVTAQAADLLPAPPMPEPFEFASGGWYLRGDIGFSNQRVDRYENPAVGAGTALAISQKGFDSAPFGGVGVGYKFNDWLRADLTGEYRGRANFRGADTVTTPGIFFGTNDVTGSKSEWVGMANLYFDLGTWHGFTPFIGGGVGFSNNTIHDYTDRGLAFDGAGVFLGNGLSTARSHSETHLAWAAHAGVAYAVSPNFSIEFAYRYMFLGDARTGTLVGFDGTVTPPTRLRDIDSHDFKVGFRWMLGENGYGEHPPLMRKY